MGGSDGSFDVSVKHKQPAHGNTSTIPVPIEPWMSFVVEAATKRLLNIYHISIDVRN